MIKIVLTPKEVNQILGNYLMSKGKLKNQVINATWNIDRFNPELSTITITQDD